MNMQPLKYRENGIIESGTGEVLLPLGLQPEGRRGKVDLHGAFGQLPALHGRI